MKDSASSDKYLQLLLAQDSFLQSKEFEEHRARVIQRLANAAEREKLARKFTTIASCICGAIFFAVYLGALVKMQSAALPDWLLCLLATVIILSPIAGFLFVGWYVFRYRLEFVRARREARSQALLEMPRKVAELRQELLDLREQLTK